MSNKDMAELLHEIADQMEMNGERLYVVSDDYCIGINRVTDIRWDRNHQRYEIVCNCINH